MSASASATRSRAPRRPRPRAPGRGARTPNAAAASSTDGGAGQFRRRAAPLRRRGPLEQRAERRTRRLAVARPPLLLALLLRARAVDAGGRVPDELRRPGKRAWTRAIIFVARSGARFAAAERPCGHLILPVDVEPLGTPFDVVGTSIFLSSRATSRRRAWGFTEAATPGPRNNARRVVLRRRVRALPGVRRRALRRSRCAR